MNQGNANDVLHKLHLNVMLMISRLIIAMHSFPLLQMPADQSQLKSMEGTIIVCVCQLATRLRYTGHTTKPSNLRINFPLLLYTD
jgi:hypothetical protein